MTYHQNPFAESIAAGDKFLERWKGGVAAFAYGMVSIAITFFNKAVFEVYKFNASSTLTLLQIMISLLLLVVAKKWKISGVDYEELELSKAKKMLTLSVAFSLMVVTGLAALSLVNVPMFNALRRLTTFIVIVWQWIQLNKKVTMEEFCSVCLMVVGAMIASSGDLSFDLYGYSLAAINCLVTAWYLVSINQVTSDTGLSTFGLMYYNNVLSLPMVFVIVLFTEWDFIKNYPLLFDVGFLMVVFISAVEAFLLNYFMFLCSNINSPLATSITGQIKNILSTIFGLVAFGGVSITGLLALGLTISSSGAAWYAYLKYKMQLELLKKQDSCV